MPFDPLPAAFGERDELLRTQYAPVRRGPVAVTDLTAAEPERLVGFLALTAAQSMRDLLSGLPTVGDMEPEDVFLKLEGDMLCLQTTGKDGKAPPIGLGANIRV